MELEKQQHEVKRGYDRDFFMVPNGIIFEDLSSSALKLYMIFTCMADNSTGSCFPSLRTIEKLTDMSRPTINKAVRELEDKDLLHVRRTKSEPPAQNYNNIYTVLKPKVNSLKTLFQEKLNDNEYTKTEEGGGKISLPGVVKNFNPNYISTTAPEKNSSQPEADDSIYQKNNLQPGINSQKQLFKTWTEEQVSDIPDIYKRITAALISNGVKKDKAYSLAQSYENERIRNVIWYTINSKDWSNQKEKAEMIVDILVNNKNIPIMTRKEKRQAERLEQLQWLHDNPNQVCDLLGSANQGEFTVEQFCNSVECIGKYVLGETGE